MRRIVTIIPVFVSLLLPFPVYSNGRATTSTRVQSPQNAYTLSDEALAAAKRFSSDPKQRKWEDLEIVLKELSRNIGTAAAPKLEYEPISRQQLIDLLGPPSGEDQSRGGVLYGHSFGDTMFYFEGDKLKSEVTLRENTVWYDSYPSQPAVMRAWYKVRRWSIKLVRVFF